MIRFMCVETGLSFPDFEQGSRLDALAHNIAKALGTTVQKPVGSPLEVLVRFEGYPEEFALWWDGFTCELGCGGRSDLNMDAIAKRLLNSGLFLQA